MADTVMEFTYAQFDDNWNKPSAYREYVSTQDGAKLTVVAEDNTGAKTTYFFQLRKDAWVQFSKSENLVFIPDRCLKKADGDLTKCGE